MTLIVALLRQLSVSSRKWPLFSLATSLSLISLTPTASRCEDAAALKPAVTLAAPEIKDQDDTCVWVHPTDRELSTVICSDKSANGLFVYDLAGKLLQHIPAAKPGNIDIRQGVKIDGAAVDLVVVNQRADTFKLQVYRVIEKSRQLERIDSDDLVTGPNYGGCLYHSRKTGQFYFICTSEAGTVEQHEILGAGNGKVTGRKVRQFPLGKCEGAVADDKTSTLFIGEEKKGVWRFGAEPNADANGALVIKVGDHGLKGDVEGLAILRDNKLGDYLFVSDQGSNRFKVYQLQSPHAFVTDFSIAGAEDTDGIEISTMSFGGKFGHGIFACHTGLNPHAVLLTPLSDILPKLNVAQSQAGSQK